MNIVRDNIFEDFIGFAKDPYNPEILIKIIRNPNTLKTLANACRGVSDREGNLYIADYDGDILNITHSKMINWLCVNDYLDGVYDDYNVNDGWINVVCWQRDDREDFLMLSESYYLKDGDEKMKEGIIEMSEKLSEKSPIKFQLIQMMSEYDLMSDFS